MRGRWGVAVIVAAGLAACSSGGEQVHLSALRGKAINGGSIGTADTSARVLVLNVMGSWCPPCIAEADGFASVADTYRNRGVGFVALAEREDSRANVLTFIKAHHIHYPVYYDGDAQMELRVAPQAGIPTTIIFRKGQVFATLRGEVRYSTLRDQVKAALRAQ